jgi:hypothetical protein
MKPTGTRMKAFPVHSGLLVAVLICGCASFHRALVLGPVGPSPQPSSGSGQEGFLQVFSAFDPTPGFSGSPYHYYYTDYRVLSNDGSQLIKQVHNNSGKLLEGPKRVELPAGAYRVLARANGYGVVTVAVVIRPGQVTAVHLEGGTWWPASSPIFQSNPVRLPHGQIVGWRAPTDDAHQSIQN